MKYTQPEEIIALLQQGSFETKCFPVEECCRPGIPRPHYLCVAHDSMLGTLSLHMMVPNTCPDIENPSRSRFYWSDKDRDIDHIANSVHGDAERVIAWKRLSEYVELSLEFPEEE